ILGVVSSASAFAQTADDLFDGTVLHEIRLDVDPKDWQTLQANPPSDAEYSADLHWRDVTVHNIGIRQRGASTRSGIKPGLHINFDQFVPNQTFLGLSSMSLMNNLEDASMMKERVVMEVFSKLGIPAPREVSATVYVNGNYYGVYTVLET